jgi:AAA domain
VGGSQILQSVKIEGLFGYVNYDLSFEADGHDSNMNLLYGENGSGKTTVLRLQHSCLSSSNVEGLRSWLAKGPLKPFAGACEIKRGRKRMMSSALSPRAKPSRAMRYRAVLPGSVAKW